VLVCQPHLAAGGQCQVAHLLKGSRSALCHQQHTLRSVTAAAAGSLPHKTLGL
jgi:hypothetical protein